MKKVAAVYVTYYPNRDRLKRSLESVAGQVDRVFIIDNTPEGKGSFFDDEKTTVVHLMQNTGIAFAQNVGIKMALEEGAEYIMLSDQDSIYPAGYIKGMTKVFETDEKIAAVAPLFKDTNQERESEGFIVWGGFFAKRVFLNGQRVEVLHAIASGKVLNAKFLGEIGLMDEKLFIDWVDLEWCWRARKKGYKVIGEGSIKIEHTLGDRAINIGYRDVNLRSYIRHYYMTRNAFYLALYSESLSAVQKLYFFLRAFRYPIAFPILAKPRLKNLKYSWLGVLHGITKKLGKLELKR